MSPPPNQASREEQPQGDSRLAELLSLKLFGDRAVVIAIDGPAQAGKTSTAEELFKFLHSMKGFAALSNVAMNDSGSLFRAVVHQLLEDQNAPQGLREKVTQYGERLRTQAGAKLELSTEEREYFHTLTSTLPVKFEWRLVNGEIHQKIFLTNGGGRNRDISAEIRAPQVDAMVSAVASIAEVRDAIKDRQLVEAKGGVITTGRAQGQEIFGDTQPIEDQFKVIRVYLTVDTEEAARRMVAKQINAELQGKPRTFNSKDIKAIIESGESPGDAPTLTRESLSGMVIEEQQKLEERNQKDWNRQPFPLLKPEDIPEGAFKVDSSELSLKQVITEIAGKLQTAIREELRAAGTAPALQDEFFKLFKQKLDESLAKIRPA